VAGLDPPGCPACVVTLFLLVAQAFIQYYKDQGWKVTVGPEGFLLRRRHEAQAWMCVHGGSTGTVAAILDGRRAVIANVGDSTALVAGVSGPGCVRHISSWAEASDVSATSSLAAAPASSFGAASVTQLSSDHSPENPEEFIRMREFRPCPTRKHHPELLFVYDTLSSSKLSCPPIYAVDAEGTPTPKNRGAYYKNVRNEWATLVAVPPFARYAGAWYELEDVVWSDLRMHSLPFASRFSSRFQDALAFTRSIGDFHLQTYGVSYVADDGRSLFVEHLCSLASVALTNVANSFVVVVLGACSHTPTVCWVDLGASSEGTKAPPLALVLCSDGVWDNWVFEDLSKFVLDPARLKQVFDASSGSQTATNDLMAANLERAHINFGSSADNMTAVLAYLLPE